MQKEKKPEKHGYWQEDLVLLRELLLSPHYYIHGRIKDYLGVRGWEQGLRRGFLVRASHTAQAQGAMGPR